MNEIIWIGLVYVLLALIIIAKIGKKIYTSKANNLWFNNIDKLFNK